MTLAAAKALDVADPLAPLRDAFLVPPDLTYLDGNSLGVLPRATPERLRRTIEREWGDGLIRSWNDAGWIDMSRRIGDGIAELIGVGAAQVNVGDSTSVNLFKVLSAAAAMAKTAAPGRRVILSERGNFPTDLYIAASVAASAGLELRLVEADEIAGRLDGSVAILLLTHVDYRSGRMTAMEALGRAAHDAGALAVWDLAHSAGAVPVDLLGAEADFAVGCGYKYLNGGPGAPAFLWAHPRHIERMDREGLRQPLSGWLGHAAPFEFAASYRPAAGIDRFTCGTPPVLSLAALDVGVEVFTSAEPLGGLPALRAKSLALTDFFIDAVETRCADHGLMLVTPREHAARGSQVSFMVDDRRDGDARHDRVPTGYALMQALISRGVIGDFRTGDGSGARPDLLRFGFTPLYTRFADAWRAAETLREVLADGAWLHVPRAAAGKVT